MNLQDRKFVIDTADGEIKFPPVFGKERGIKELKRSREEIKQRLFEVLGGQPVSTPLKPVIDHVELHDGYEMLHLSYASLDGDRVTAYLLKPANIKDGTIYPGILAMHQTYPDGKAEVVGISGNPDYSYGKELVTKGYIVLCPDVFTAGERIPDGYGSYDTGFFYKKYPAWSAMGKMMYDHMQGVDYLASLPYVDSERIGAIGHSLGGHNAFFLGAFDERIKAVVSSCGLCSITGDPNPFRWSRDEWFVYFNNLRNYFKEGWSPFEFHEVLALLAPRAFFNWSTMNDKIFPHWQGVTAIQDRVEEVYELCGAGDRLQFEMGEGVHEFPADVRAKAYEFLCRHLIT